MDIIFNPIAIFWFLAVLALVLYKTRRKKAGKIVLIFAVTELFIFTVSPLPDVMVRHLEQQYRPLRLSQEHAGLPVLVLGGGHTNDPDIYPVHKLSDQALGRLAEGIRIYRAMKGTTMIFSGYSSSGKTPIAIVTAQAAVSLGVNLADTLTIVKPANTWEEAVAFKGRFGSHKFILVTSALHMPRAMETFNRMGLQPVPAPAGYIVKHDPDEMLYDWWPSAGKAANTQKALHEYAGQLYYRWFKKP